MIWRCDLVPQYEKYRQRVLELTDNVCMTGRYILADEVRKFEEAFAKYLGVKRVVSVANGTDALMLIMLAMGIGPGDEVITSPYTAIPTISAIVSVGAKPVFIDIDIDTFLMDISLVQQAITKKTKAIIPVHIFGNMVDIDALKIVCGDIPIIEDACQAHGSSIRGQKAGSMGYAAAFSFYPTKNLGAYGDGGAIASNNEEFSDLLVKMRMYGMVDKDHIIINGINSRLDEIQAAILREKLSDLDDMNEARKAIAHRYHTKVTNQHVHHQKVNNDVVSNYHVYSVRYTGNREGLIQKLEKDEIQTNIYYVVPLHLQEANRFLGYKEGDLPIVEKLCRQALALTLYPELSWGILDYVIEKINEYGE